MSFYKVTALCLAALGTAGCKRGDSIEGKFVTGAETPRPGVSDAMLNARVSRAMVKVSRVTQEAMSYMAMADQARMGGETTVQLDKVK